jgi:hypothetical protein
MSQKSENDPIAESENDPFGVWLPIKTEMGDSMDFSKMIPWRTNLKQKK